MMITVGFWR